MAEKLEQQRRAGRPDAQGSEALDRHILATATRLFTEQGYAATSIEQIAVVGGMGKQSIYRRYSSKQEVFKAVISDLCRRLVAAATHAESSQADPLLALREACRALLDMATSPEATAVYRVLIGESRRFPAFVDHMTSEVSEPLNSIIGRLLRAAREAGAIRPDCDEDATGRALTGLFTGWASHQALLGQPVFADKRERDAFCDCAWSVFLNGVLAKPYRSSEGSR